MILYISYAAHFTQTELTLKRNRCVRLLNRNLEKIYIIYYTWYFFTIFFSPRDNIPVYTKEGREPRTCGRRTMCSMATEVENQVCKLNEKHVTAKKMSLCSCVLFSKGTSVHFPRDQETNVRSPEDRGRAMTVDLCTARERYFRNNRCLWFIFICSKTFAVMETFANDCCKPITTRQFACVVPTRTYGVNVYTVDRLSRTVFRLFWRLIKFIGVQWFVIFSLLFREESW